MHPRFGVSQSNGDGGINVTPIDNFSWSASHLGKQASVNGYMAPQEKLSHETLDDLARIMEEVAAKTGCVPGIWKADIDSAFRRLPICAKHRWVSGFSFKQGGDVWISQHHACPFGAIASVHAWERIGEAIAKIAWVVLRLPMCRHVDDYFSAERCVPLAPRW